MNKIDVVRAVSDRATVKLQEVTDKPDARVTRVVTEMCLDAAVEIVKKVLAADHGEKISFGDIGKFYVKEVDAKDGVTKLSGAETPWHKDAHAEIAFKVGSAVRDI